MCLACREESKNEYTKCSKLSRGFPLQRLEDSPRTKHASVSTQQPEDYAPRAQWYLGKFATNSLFLMKCCFPMRHPFTREGIFNTHNDHIWAVENPHAIRRRAAQIRFSVNVNYGRSPDRTLPAPVSSNRT
ncbi:hypothetical protein TNCV_3417591 [Trichonephila clavipes]|nr:hypothetical protein TNCV_3417591 [Trichonephila clavipes]